VVHVA